jgi:hypothetical protein
LLEPQRTNLLAHSEHIEGYLKERVIITANSITSPEGVQNAAKINADSSPNNTHNAYLGPYTNTAGNVTYSGFFKKGEYNWVHFGGGAASSKTWFNLNTGVVGSQSSDVVTASMIDFGNGWYRCIAVVNYASTSNYVEFGPASVDNSRVISGTPIGGIYCWGIQFEDSASYATSYIPTYGSAVTRNQDTGSISSASSLIGQTEGTLFLKFKHTNEAVGLVSINTGNIGNRLYIGTDTNGLISQVRVSYSTQAFFDTSLTIGTTYKCALAYKENDFVLYVNGSQIGVDTNGLVPSSLSRIAFQQANGNDSMPQPLNEVLVFKTRLTNAELATLTTI